ncbi:DMT family transporter [Priestia megaterium]|jgi:drug/metabolite transporter (DMT)-like permease|uniref:DMT family transporter n=1 Tax=Priestia megaterium TaxID=1404 RepID=UPI002A6A478A|nr:EamA family transporter [Priestia megaterium]MDY0943717.1 EamA family transporter [Priestia megaterium]
MDTMMAKQQERLKTRRVRRGNSLYISASIIAVLLWSTSFVGTKIAYTSFPPLTLGAARFVIAAVILGLILFIKKGKIKPSVKDIGLMSISGVLGTTLYFSLENIGVELTTASNAAIIVASYPAITALMEFLFFKTKTSWLKGIGIGVAMIGVYQISYSPETQTDDKQLVGNIILIVAGFIFALYNFTTRKVVQKYSMITISFYQTLAGAITFIPLAFIEESSWQTPDIKSFLILLYLGVFCSVIAFLLYNFGLRKLSSSSAMTLMNLVPIFGVLFSVLLLNEVLSIYQLIGGVIIILGVVLSIRETSKK